MCAHGTTRRWRRTSTYLDVAEDLRKAMSRNPYLKLWVCCGYYDLATPYYAAGNVLHGMQLDPSIRDNLRMTFYESGHMIYINHPSLLANSAMTLPSLCRDALKPRVVPLQNHSSWLVVILNQWPRLAGGTSKG